MSTNTVTTKNNALYVKKRSILYKYYIKINNLT